MKILQTNLCRGRAAHDLAYATGKQKDVDLLIVGEPNKNITKSSNWIKDQNQDIAILFLNNNIEVVSVTVFRSFVCVSFNDFSIYACYISPNMSLLDFERTVDNIMNSIHQSNREVIVLGDINAKSIHWGSPVNDRRGEYWMEWMCRLN